MNYSALSSMLLVHDEFITIDKIMSHTHIVMLLQEYECLSFYFIHAQMDSLLKQIKFTQWALNGFRCLWKKIVVHWWHSNCSQLPIISSKLRVNKFFAIYHIFAIFAIYPYNPMRQSQFAINSKWNMFICIDRLLYVLNISLWR